MDLRHRRRRVHARRRLTPLSLQKITRLWVAWTFAFLSLSRIAGEGGARGARAG